MSNEPAKADGGAKKKRNRKKKAKKDTNNNASSMEAPKKEEPKSGNAAMNSHEVLRNDINAQGYSFEEIDKAMEEMWDKGLAYDEVEAVLKYLKTGGKDDKKKGEDNKSVEESKSIEGDSDLSEEAAEEEAPKKQMPVVKQAPMTMVAKLDMVAGFENMTDAVFALTEWVNKAAKPKDIEELCGAQNTSALPKIFCRSITECEDNNRFETVILPAMDRLMSALLGKCGVAATSFSETRICFESLLKQARRVYLLQQPDANDYADRVSHFIVSRISMALEGCNVIEHRAATTTGNGVKTSSSSNNNKIPDVDDAIAQLLATRELHKAASKRFSAQAGSACATLTTINGAASTANGHARESSYLDKTDIFLAVGGAGVKETFEQERAKLEQLRAKVTEIDSAKAKELQAKLDEVQSERQMIAKRIAELRVSIENLESHDAELCSQVVKLETEVEAERSSNNQEANKLNDEVKEAQVAVKYGNSIGTLVDLLKSYDDALDAAINGSVAMDTDNAAEAASKSMDLFTSRVGKYFAAEAQCVDFLKKRVAANTEEIPALKLEITECEGLGMTTTIGQMEASVKEKESQLEKDTALVDRLTGEASAMFESLITRLEQYAAAMGGGGNSTSYYSILKSIPADALRLGISEPERLTRILEKNGGSGPRSTDPPIVGTPNDGKVAPIGTPKATQQKKAAVQMTAQSTSIPKFTWAAASSNSEKAAAPKASLVDIQKEELESRNVQ